MRHFTIPLLWSIVIGVLCGLPGNSFPNLSLWKLLQFDSFAHAFVFSIFAFTWAVGLSKQKHKPLLRQHGDKLAVAAGVLYGALVEVAQYYIFVRRSTEWSDVIADAIGCFIGWGIFRLIYSSVLRKDKLLMS